MWEAKELICMGEARRKRESLKHLREVSAREAAELFAERRHILVAGQPSSSSAHAQLFNFLAQAFHDDIQLCVVKPFYNPDVRPFVSSSVENHRHPYSEPYPEITIAFLPDNIEIRRSVDAAVLIIAAFNGARGMSSLEHFPERGPLVLLDSDDLVQEAVAIIVNTLEGLRCGTADNLTMN